MVLNCCRLLDNSSNQNTIKSFIELRNELNCSCGEAKDLDWHWGNLNESSMDPLIRRSNTLVDISSDKRTVRFHRGYSIGTAAVKGDRPFAPGQEYFWQIKILTKPYGTDVMIGIGTERFNIYKNQTKYTSLLGSDSESWGFSYRGSLQHDGKFSEETNSFTQGSIIGVHLNLFQGTLKFYLDGVPQGKTFEGLNNKGPFYPMVCSTAAYSSIRLIKTQSYPASLQLECFKNLSPELISVLDAIPGLRNHEARDIAVFCQYNNNNKSQSTPVNDDSKFANIVSRPPEAIGYL